MRAVRLRQSGFVSLRDQAEVGEGASLRLQLLAGGADWAAASTARSILAGEGAYAEVVRRLARPRPAAA